ncbi:helix-turn-helix domain-containing protein [Amycolatopsis sp. EV170708-02-1]|uniref:helix-turn-helix domain-containing protein n=1 Tax=Amycolatopsis sp. EV170708-02-1 TaxID=2919322 RepID=UPI0037BF279F
MSPAACSSPQESRSANRANDSRSVKPHRALTHDGYRARSERRSGDDCRTPTPIRRRRYHREPGLAVFPQLPQGPHAALRCRCDLAATEDPTPTHTAGLVNVYHDGRSIRQLADKHRMTYSQTRRVLLAAGVRLRSRGAPPALPAAKPRDVYPN